jgi:uncharacterized membrane protein
MTTNEPPEYPNYPGAEGNQPPAANGPTSDLPAYGSVPPPDGYSPPPGGHYPPPAPGGSASGYDATAAFGYAWRAFKANAGPLVLATVVVAVIVLALSFISNAIAPQPEFLTADAQFSFDGGALLSNFIAQTIVGGITYVFGAMLIRGCLDVTEGRAFSMSEAFARLPTAKVFLTGIVLSLLTTLGILLCILPGIIFSIFAFFTIYFVLDRDESVFAAIGSSFRTVGNNFGQALLSGLLAILVILAGALALVVGLLVAAPVVTLAAAYAYRSFTGQPIAEVQG